MNYSDFKRYLERRKANLTAMRDVHVSEWREIADYFCPEAGRYLGQEPGAGNRTRNGRMDKKIINSHSRQVVQYISGGMHTGLTPQNQPWFRLGFSDRRVAGIASVNDYLEGVREEIAYQLGKSNFYVVAQQVYSNTALFGQAPVIVTSPSGSKPLRFTLCDPGTYAIDTDGNEEVTALLRIFTMSVADAADEFGEDVLTDSQRDALTSDQGYKDRITIYNLIEPNDERTQKIHRLKDKVYRSAYWMSEEGGKLGILAVRGFSYNPILCPRWLVFGNDPYGAGPGLFAIGDSKSLQAYEGDILRLLKKYVDPPLTAPSELQKEDLRTYPGGVTFIPDTAAANGSRPAIAPLYTVQPDFKALRSEAKEAEQRMDDLFYTNLFMSILSQPMKSGVTATEVAERHEEKLMLLAPILNRMHGEFLAPVIDAAYAALHERGFFEDAPPELVGEAFDVEYMSVLIQAQKLVGMRAIQEFFGFAAQIDQVEPGTLRKLINIRSAIKASAVAYGLPQGCLRDDKEVAQMDKAEAAQAQEMQQLQQGAALAKIAKDAGSVPTGEGSIFGQLASGMGAV